MSVQRPLRAKQTSRRKATTSGFAPVLSKSRKSKNSENLAKVESSIFHCCKAL
jgi:hypothetical protein